MEQEESKILNKQDEDIKTKSSILNDIELENNNGDSQLEPGEVKDDIDDDITVSINSSTAEIISMTIPSAKNPLLNEPNFNNFHSKFHLSGEGRRTTNNVNNFMMQPVLGKEIARKRLKALGNFKKIQMESKNYMTPQKQKNRKRLGNQGIKSSNNDGHRKDKPPTPHEKAKLTKQEIEQMKKREDRAIPCLYYDAALIHRIRADSPSNSITKGSNESISSSLKNSEIYMKTFFEENKNSNDREEANGDKMTSMSSVNHRNQKRKDLITKLSPSPPGIKRKMIYDKDRSIQRYTRQYNSEFISRKPYHKDSQYLNYCHKKFPNQRFNMSATSRDKLKNKFKMRYTKTKPVISYAFNPNIVVDKRFLSPASSSPALSAINSNISGNNNDYIENDDNSSIEKSHKVLLSPNKKVLTKTKRKMNPSISITNDDGTSNSQEKSDSASILTKMIKGKFKEKTSKKRTHKFLSRKLEKLKEISPMRSLLINKREKYQQKIAKKGVRPSFDDEDENYGDDNDEKQGINGNDQIEDEETTVFVEEEITQFPLSKDETITTIVEDDLENIANNIGKPLISSSPTNKNQLDTVEHVINSAIGNNESPDTDDYMANWEEDETINLFEPITTVSTSAASKIIDEMKLSERDTGIFTNSSANQLNFESDTEDGEIKDGLGTPIFVNPSPPTELIINNNNQAIETTTDLNDLMFKDTSETTEVIIPNVNNKKSDVDEKNTEKIISSSLVSESTHLFGMQHIYEQFIQSVNEAGIDLSSEGHASVITTISPHQSAASTSVTEIPESFLQNGEENIASSPTRTPPLSLSRRSSTTSSTSSSSSSSSSSFSTDNSSSTSSTSSSSSSTSSSPSSSPLISPTKIVMANADDEDGGGGGNKDVDTNKMITGKIMFMNNNSSSTSGNKELLNLSLDDTNRIRALQKRCIMLKNLQKQSEEMDDEDKQCLLGVKKLIEAEQKLLMRKFNCTRLENLLIQAGSSEDDENDIDDGENDKEKSLQNVEKIMKAENKIDQVQNDNDNDDKSNKNSMTDPERIPDDKIFNSNRETIKLKLPLKVAKGNAIKCPKATTTTDHESSGHSDIEDQDFTEKLMRTSSSSKRDKKSSTPSRDCADLSSYRVKRDSQSRRRSHSHSRSCSPRNYRSGDYRTRSLSPSPSRSRRSSPQASDRKAGRRAYRKRRIRTPSPKKSRKTSPKDYRRGTSGRRRSRERNRYCSPPSRRRSRSPYNSRQQSHSPLRFRPPSPTTTPPQDSREPSPECNGITNYLPEEYYINTPGSSGYYYLMPHTDGTMSQDRSKSSRLYPTSYHNYTQYNPYTNEYMPISSLSLSTTSENDYQLNYGNEYISSSNLISVYSKIPVIGTNSMTQAEYYYGSMGLQQQQQQQIMTTGDSVSPQSLVLINSREIGTQVAANITQSRDGGGGGKSSTFVVQKGNVLEIVPAPVISTSSNNSAIDAKLDAPENKFNNSLPAEKIIINKKKSERKKKRRSSWEEEVAKRHIMSAVLKLNKENDGVVRGILCNKANPDMQQLKEKKKVLFADGVTPGKSSSTSEDEDSPRLRNRKRKKRRCSLGENKENENSIDANLIVEMKIDQALEDAPPPPAPPGSPPPNLEQPILIRPSSPMQFLYFHYDNVVNSMYVSQIATPIPPRLLNRNFRMNAAMMSNPPAPIHLSSSSSDNIENNNSVTTASTSIKTSTNEVDVNSDLLSSTISVTTANLSDLLPFEQNSNAGESNQMISIINGNGNNSAFEQNKSLSSPVNRIPVQTSSNMDHQTIVQQFCPVVIGTPRMIQITGQQRQSAGQSISGGTVCLRPPLRNSPRLIRPNFIVPPPSNISRSNLLPLTPGPAAQPHSRHFQQQCRMSTTQTSLSGSTAQHFTNSVPATTIINSSKTFSDDSSLPITAKNSTPVGKSIPSIVGKVATSQLQNPTAVVVTSYSGSQHSSPYSSVISRSRSFTSHSPSTQQFGNNNGSFNQSPRISSQSTPPGAHFIQQQQQWSCVRTIPVVHTIPILPSTTTASTTITNEISDATTTNSMITVDNVSPLVHPAETGEISSSTSAKSGSPQLTSFSPSQSSQEATSVSTEIDAV